MSKKSNEYQKFARNIFNNLYKILKEIRPDKKTTT